MAEVAFLRASDSDRDVVLQVLAEAYADGRLDREEHDDRASAAASAKTLGQLPALIADLVPRTTGPRGNELALASPQELQARAVARNGMARRRALSRMLVPSLVTIAIWLALAWTPHGLDPGFPWPLFVVLFTGIRLLDVVLNKQDLIERERRRLEGVQLKALEPPEKGER